MSAAARLDRLPLLEHAVLWSMRAWMIGLCRGVELGDRIDRLFDELSVRDGAAKLNRFMTCLSAGTCRTLEVHCTCWPGISDDETALMDMLALIQEHETAAARHLLDGMIAPARCRAVIDSACLLIGGINHAGHHMPRASDAMRRHRLVPPRAIAPGAFILH